MRGKLVACESEPIAACLFSTLSLLSVLSSVSVTAKTRSLLEWNVLSSVLSSIETTIAGVRQSKQLSLANEKLTPCVCGFFHVLI